MLFNFQPNRRFFVTREIESLKRQDHGLFQFYNTLVLLQIYFLTTAQQDRYVRLHKICFAILVITLKITEVGPLQWLPRVYGMRYLWSLKVRTQLTL